MKKSFVTEAINLRNYPLNDNDTIVVMFSKTKGLMRAIAKGSKSPKSKLGARIQMFIANKLMLNEGKNFDTITQAQSVNTFFKIRQDFDKLTYSMYVAELVNNFCSKFYNNDENTSEIYDLIYKVYQLISSSKTKEEVLIHMIKFLTKFLNILGWGLDFQYCSMCQKELDFSLDRSSVFSFEMGGFVCPDCNHKLQGETINIHNKIKMFLKAQFETSMEEKTSYDEVAGIVVLEKCFEFLKKYIDNLSSKRTKVFEVLEKVKTF
ncbi:DNA repair protein RecO [bacterium]|nr:DNA repair protein RecO [bacterium]